MSLFQRRGSAQCFFCHSTIPAPRDYSNFRCPQCTCWNRYDAHGEILSWEPAMQDESLNKRSFSKRGSPSKERLPTMYGKGPFCHTCQTNQMLLVNLLSNYLPDPNSPEYERREAMLPEYRESLHVRYPPVCNSCLPAVEEEILDKEKMARTNALGSWLKETKGKERTRRVSGPTKAKEKLPVKLLLWRIRGCLWAITFIVAIAGYTTRLLEYSLPLPYMFRSLFLPFLAVLSLFWTFWDPTYASLHRARREGRDVRLRGKQKYIALQAISWLLRVISAVAISLMWYRPHLDYLHLIQTPNSLRTRVYFTSCLVAELSIFISSWFVLQLQQPPTIRLLDSTIVSSRAGTPASRAASPLSPPPPVADNDLFASLTLSSKPVVSKPPIFGVPSLQPPLPQPDMDAMDWTPTSGGPPKPQSDSFWLRPQRFFAPENPTGLEGLFERTRLGGGGDDVTMKDASTQESSNAVVVHLWSWWWVYALSILPVMLLLLFQRWRMPEPTVHTRYYPSVESVESEPLL
ncbi:hypothetical protein BDZ89DRAFT_986161 [Hymenopellis radicata]|nr:hypothetical protein BDZ89DRAFT_986161 [Hymenopellis radicata]